MDVYWKYVIAVVILLAVLLLIREIRRDLADTRQAEEQLKADNEQVVKDAAAFLGQRAPSLEELKQRGNGLGLNADRERTRAKAAQASIPVPRPAPVKPAPSSTTRVSNHLRVDRDDDDDAWRRHSTSAHQAPLTPTTVWHTPTQVVDSYAGYGSSGSLCSGESSPIYSDSGSSCPSDSSSSCSSSCD